MTEKVRIISEKVGSEFKELKKDEKEPIKADKKKENLEEVEFSDEPPNEQFVSKGVSPSAPILEDLGATQNTRAGLEQEMQNVPSGSVGKKEEGEQIYNLPDYAASYDESFPERKEMRERGFIIKQRDIGSIKPRAEVEQWHELKQAGGRHTQEDAVIEADRKENQRKMPWDRKREYKVRR